MNYLKKFSLKKENKKSKTEIIEEKISINKLI
jgi:hypothetical protein